MQRTTRVCRSRVPTASRRAFFLLGLLRQRGMKTSSTICPRAHPLRQYLHSRTSKWARARRLPITFLSIPLITSNDILSRYPGSSCASPRHYLSLTPIHEDRHHSANMLSLGAQRPPLELRLQTPLFNEPLASFPDPTPSRPSKSPSPGFQYAKHTKRAHSLASDVDAERSDNEQSPRSRSSSPPPRKRTKTSYINTSAFLDLDAEQSGDDDEPDDPNEDEETLSDKGTS